MTGRMISHVQFRYSDHNRKRASTGGISYLKFHAKKGEKRSTLPKKASGFELKASFISFFIRLHMCLKSEKLYLMREIYFFFMSTMSVDFNLHSFPQMATSYRWLRVKVWVLQQLLLRECCRWHLKLHKLEGYKIIRRISISSLLAYRIFNSSQSLNRSSIWIDHVSPFHHHRPHTRASSSSVFQQPFSLLCSQTWKNHFRVVHTKTLKSRWLSFSGEAESFFLYEKWTSAQAFLPRFFPSSSTPLILLFALIPSSVPPPSNPSPTEKWAEKLSRRISSVRGFFYAFKMRVKREYVGVCMLYVSMCVQWWLSIESRWWNVEDSAYNYTKPLRHTAAWYFLYDFFASLSLEQQTLGGKTIEKL